MTFPLRAPLQLLLVEDNRADADLARELLGEAGLGAVVVTHVTSLKDAQRSIASASPSCVLLDLGLPDAEGSEALVGVLAASPSVPVVVLTGRDDATLGTRAVQHGGDVRPSDTVARFGGDEFVIVCEEMVSSSEALYLGERISSSLGSPFVIDGTEMVVSVSLGIALAQPEQFVAFAPASCA